MFVNPSFVTPPHCLVIYSIEICIYNQYIHTRATPTARMAQSNAEWIQQQQRFSVVLAPFSHASRICNHLNKTLLVQLTLMSNVSMSFMQTYTITLWLKEGDAGGFLLLLVGRGASSCGGAFQLVHKASCGGWPHGEGRAGLGTCNCTSQPSNQHLLCPHAPISESGGAGAGATKHAWCTCLGGHSSQVLEHLELRRC